MATPTPPKNEHLDNVFEFVATREAEAMKTARMWVHNVGEAMPVELPLVSELTRELLDFTEELLRIQREFARDLLAETHAVLHRVSTGAPAAPAHRATPAPKARKTAA